MTEFVSYDIASELDRNLAFSKLECINGKCGNHDCSFEGKLSHTELVIPDDQMIKYYESLVIQYTYTLRKTAKRRQGVKQREKSW